MDWVDPVTKVLAGLPGVMLDAYRMHRDGSVPEQLESSAQQHARELMLGHRLHLKQALWDTRLRVLEQVELSRMTAEHTQSPFGYVPGADVHAQAVRLTDSGKRPALLIAPFLDTSRTVQDNIEQPYTYNVAIRSAWQDSPWNSDAHIDLGLITHPLLRTDMNLRGIRQLLADLPIILVHGFVEKRKVRPEIVAWNIIRGSADRPDSLPEGAIQISISVADTADESPRSGSADSSEQVGLACSRLCAVLAEWFYVARGRAPSRNRDMPEELARATAVGSLVALSLGLNRGDVEPLTAVVHQAVLYADLEEAKPLAVAAKSALELIQAVGEDTAERHLRMLRRITQEAASSGTLDQEPTRMLASRIADEHDRACLALIRRQLYG